MNPVFLKHREKVEYSDYDGSDLVYPGAKTGGKSAPKTEAINLSKIKSQNLGLSPSHTKSDSPLAKDKRNSSPLKGGNEKAFTGKNMRATTNSSTRGKTVSPLRKKKFSPPKGPLKTVDFELAGVLGHDFRSQITDYANECGVTGYVGRTNIGTIAGVFQGEVSTVDRCKQWIKEGGTAKHKIDKCVFRNEKAIQQMNLEVFIKFVEIIKRDPNDNILTQKEGKPTTPPKNETKKSGKSPKK